MSCSNTKQIVISIPELYEGEVYITYQDPQMIANNDRMQIVKGNLTKGEFVANLDSIDFEGKVYECVVTIINKDKQFACQTPMPVQKGKTIKLTITSVKEYLQKTSTLKVSYSGSKYAEEFSSFWNEINQSFELLSKSNDNKIYSQQVDIYKNYLKQNPKSEYAYAMLLSEVNMLKDDNNPVVAFAQELANQKTDNPWQEYLNSYFKTKKLQQISSGTLVFKAQNLKGDTITERDLKGKLVLVDFWASWCKPCIETIPKIEVLHNKYANKGLQVVSISVDTNPNDWLKYMNKHSVPWLSLWGNGRELTERYGFQYIPHILLADSTGKVLQNGIDANELENFISNYLK